MPETWKPIYLSAKVFGHLSRGLYRTPAGAIKELISNSFDADATLVRIHTGFPRFETFSCEDDGSGMSVDEFQRLMNRGIGSSYKRASTNAVTEKYKRPPIGRLGLGILSLAQICTRFDILSHSEQTRTAFRATIQFPAYTRQEMDKIAKRISRTDDDELIHGGTYQITEEKYDAEKRGVRVFTKYLQEAFRKRMRTLQRLANKRVFNETGPYKTFDRYVDAIYNASQPTPSLNLLSDYDQLLFGLALAPPLPSAENRNVAVELPAIRGRQGTLRAFNFEVRVDNITLLNPVALPSDREGHRATQCSLKTREEKVFELRDGAVKELCSVVQRSVAVKNSDFQFHLYELRYENENVAGSPLEFSGYLFQQTGRLYPRDIQGVLIRINDVAVGKYDNSMLTYPFAEGPRYSMVSSELFIHRGFEDALNIDRDSFNELHPHYMRVQSYLHGLLQRWVFPQTWTEEKERNKARRDQAAQEREASFVERYRKTTGDELRTIQRIEKRTKATAPAGPKASPVEFASKGEIEIDRTHPLLQPLFRRRKYAPLVDKVVVAFERANHEPTASRRRELFYRLLAEIFSDL
jgi:hypothetical protein